MDDAEQSKGRASSADDSAATSSTGVVEARPSRVAERVPDAEDAATNDRAGPGGGVVETDLVTDEPVTNPAANAVTNPVTELGRGEAADGEVEAADPPDADDPPAAPRSGRRRLPAWIELPVLIAIAMIAVLAINSWVAQPFVIPSGSMENTLQVGDRVLVNKLAYRFGDIERGDIVVFDGQGSFTPEGKDGPDPVTGALRTLGGIFGFANPDDTDFVKRVIGIGGDFVKCCDAQGRVSVNGVPLDEGDYLYPGDKPSDFPFEAEVPEGKLWVMGDHRSNSADSRDHLGDPGGGMVPEKRVIGRAQWIIWPFGRIQGTDRPETFERSDFDRRG